MRWIVPTGPGSAVDVNARRVTPKLAEALGQPVIVENRPGANSMIGAREAARSAPDGYTLYQAVVNNAINDALAPDPCCVLNDKLVPVTRLYTTPLVMVVHPGVPAATLKEYVALAKAKPNTLTYASGGTGAITQMVGELLKLTADIQVREIPYKAIGAELPDLTGGHVATAFLSPVVIRDHVRAGKLRALRHRRPPAPARSCPTCRPWPRPAIRSRAWAGTASSSRPARRRRSSTGCRPRSPRRCARRKCRTTRRRSAPSRAASGRRSSPPSCAAKCRSGARSSRTPASRRE